MTGLVKVGSGTGTRLVVVGEIDSANRDEIVAFVRDALDGGTTDLVLDMSGVTFIDCAGLGGLLKARSVAVESRRSFRAVELSLPVRRLLELTDTLSMFSK